MSLLLTLAVIGSRRPTQIGLVLAILGSGGLGLAALAELRELPWHWVLFGGAVLLALGFVLLLVGVHWGGSPYLTRR